MTSSFRKTALERAQRLFPSPDLLADDPHAGAQDKIKDITNVPTVLGGKTVYQTW
jgi:hypothetical protein